MRAGVTYEPTNAVNEEQLSSESEERHRDANEHTSMYLYTVGSVMDALLVL